MEKPICNEEKVKEKRERLLKFMDEHGYGFEWITCDYCLDNITCEWAYDAYNTDNDCLGEK